MRHALLAAILVHVAASSASAEPPRAAYAKPHDPRPTFSELEALKSWVAETEKAQFDFWRRYFNRPTEQFDRGYDWYTPAQYVIGAPSQPIATTRPGRGTIKGAALEKAAAYSAEKNGTALIVWRRGRIELERYAGPASAHRPMTGRSMTKSLVGALYGPAVAKGLVKSIDDPVGRYLEEWAKDPRGRITLRQLLQMSSGLEAFADISNPNEPMMRIIEGTRVNEAALSFRSVRAPGTSFSFGNAESQLLAMVLERVSGKPYWDILSEWIWRPIGAGTGIVRMDRLQGNANAFCCMLGGPHDWLRFGVMLMRDGRVGDEQVLPENWVKTMLEPAPTNANYGLHIWRGHPQRTKRLYGPGLEADLASEPYLAPDLFLMVGGGGIRMWMVPSKDLVILRLADPAPDFDETVIPNTILRALR